MSEHQYRGRPSGRRPQSRPNRRVSQNGTMHANSQQGNRRHNNSNNNRSGNRPLDAKKKPVSFWKKLLGLFGIGKKTTAKPAPRKQTETTVTKTNTRIARGVQEPRTRKAPKMPVDSPRLYVGNLSYEASESDIEDLFKGIGSVDSVEIIYNPRTHKSKGYGFVEMRNMDDALRSVEVLHEQPFMGRNLTVSAANERDAANDGERENRPEPRRHSSYSSESEKDVVVEETVTPLVVEGTEK